MTLVAVLVLKSTGISKIFYHTELVAPQTRVQLISIKDVAFEEFYRSSTWQNQTPPP